MYLIKGRFIDKTGFSFRTKAEQFGEAADAFVKALAKQPNHSPVERVTFIVKGEEPATLQLKPAPKVKSKAAAKK